MSFLLDTNVVSEWTKPLPNSGVLKWLAEVDEDRVFLSVVTVAELGHGVEKLPAGRRRSRLDEWLREDLMRRFEGRILPVAVDVAQKWGIIVARREAIGRPIQAMDALLAATADQYGLTLVTRNDSDFKSVLTDILNPWSRVQ